MDKRKIAIGAGIGAAIGAVIYAVTKKKPLGPPEPPPPEPGKATIYGIVSDAATGLPIPNVAVIIASSVVSTDATGYYLHENIVPSNYDIKFEVEGYESLTISEWIAEGANELSVELIPAGTKAEFHAGVWNSLTSEAIVDAKVTLTGPANVEQLSNTFGDVSFYGLLAGEYTITITKTNYSPISEPISIPAGRTEKEYYLEYVEPMEGIEVRWLTVEPQAVTVGEDLLISAQVLNISGREDDFDIVCEIDGMVLVQTVHFTASGNGSWDVVYFRPTMNVAGTFNVSVGPKSASIVVTEKVTGNLCCPICGAHIVDEVEITDTTILAEHLERCIGTRIKCWQPCSTGAGTCYYQKPVYLTHSCGYNVYEVEIFNIFQSVPHCGSPLITYRTSAVNKRKEAAGKLIDYIIARGIESVYCENVPEGGYPQKPA